jgi:hypothetical protein
MFDLRLRILLPLFSLLLFSFGTFGSVAMASTVAQAPKTGTYPCYRREPMVVMQNEFRYSFVTKTHGWVLVPMTVITFVPEAFKLELKNGGQYALAGTTGKGTYLYNADNNTVTFTGDIKKLNMTSYSSYNGNYVFVFEPTNKLFIQCELITGHMPRGKAPLAQRTGAAKAEDYTGRFDGSYVCRGQNTRLNLSLRAEPNGALTGNFSFGGSGTVPAGSYTMTGKWDGDAFTLSGDHWITQPKGFVMVDITGHIQSGTVTGVVLADFCSTFSAKRI